ncbi:hypothetical protein TEA_020195 [Camellia sinensis var. sinensis]|uniref:Uncharacterized protein n=1 Tax=Camellia sinensis var. sinensis TaxID=542762 RepID=A0A4V3WKM2_CAMSN|nr:hypothetical protein TEA_020195 [Camellia sinensis var. sinensis]
MISEANKNGPYLGLVIPNLFEMNPLLQSLSFTSSNLTIDFQGNANPSLNIGDVTILQYWSHTALWNWQRYGDGPEDELSLEENGDYTREIGYIKYANYATIVTECNLHDNFLNNVWYQPEEVFPIDGTPEERQHAFWVPVDSHYFELSKNLEICLGCSLFWVIVFTALLGGFGGFFLRLKRFGGSGASAMGFSFGLGFRFMGVALTMGRRKSRVGLVQPRKAWESLGIAWAELVLMGGVCCFGLGCYREHYVLLEGFKPNANLWNAELVAGSHPSSCSLSMLECGNQFEDA